MKVVEFYALWLAALESEEYRQGTESLRSPDGYCCLGVAGDVLVKNYLLGASWDSRQTSFRPWLVIPSLDRTSATLPPELENLLGLVDPKFDHSPLTKDKAFAKTLVAMNDTQGKTFKEIAAYIRQEILPTLDPEKELELPSDSNCPAIPGESQACNSNLN